MRTEKVTLIASFCLMAKEDSFVTVKNTVIKKNGDIIKNIFKNVDKKISIGNLRINIKILINLSNYRNKTIKFYII
jgi:hypothetical protein